MAHSQINLELKNYYWRGTNASGKRSTGKLLALTELEARHKLKEQHIKIVKLKKRRLSFFDHIAHKVKHKDITLLTRQLATMLSTGVSILQAIKLISGHHKKAEVRSILFRVTADIEAGVTIAKALHHASTYFDSLYVDLIHTGEQSGNLSAVFERLATYREKSEQLRSKVTKALIYPTMVLFTALIVSYLMLTLVIPEFENMYSGFGAELPWVTQQVLKLSIWVQQYSALMVILSFFFIVMLKTMYRRSWKVQLKLDQIKLALPIIGTIIEKAAIAKFSRTLATSFNAGIPILTCLQITSKTTGSLYFEQAINHIYQETSSGLPIHIAMRNTHAFPDMVIQMVMIGEESGKLDDMLNKIATVYEFEIDNTVDNLGKLLEPLIILFLGSLIGGLVIAMYLPIFNLMSVLG